MRHFRTDKAGERWARSLEAQIDTGKTVPTRTQTRRTFGDLCARYRRDVLPDCEIKEQRLRDTRLTWWEERLASIPLVGLRRVDRLELLADLEHGRGTPKGKPVGPATRNRYIGVLRHVLGMAVRWEWLEHNPASRLSRPKRDQEPPGRARYLSNEERERLLAECETSRCRVLAPWSSSPSTPAAARVS